MAGSMPRMSSSEAKVSSKTAFGIGPGLASRALTTQEEKGDLAFAYTMEIIQSKACTIRGESVFNYGDIHLIQARYISKTYPGDVFQVHNVFWQDQLMIEGVPFTLALAAFTRRHAA